MYEYKIHLIVYKFPNDHRKLKNCLCNGLNPDKIRWNNTTTVKEFVTCKNCLKILKR